MEKRNNNPAKISSISQFHTLLKLPKPLHPMISLVDNTQLVINGDLTNSSFLLDFYKISYKFSTNGKMGYGQGYYDFNEGGLMFASPNQLILQIVKKELNMVATPCFFILILLEILR